MKRVARLAGGPRSGPTAEPQSASEHLRRVILYIDVRQHQLALVHFNAAVRLDPKNVRAYPNRGRCQEWERNPQEGLADHNEALRLDLMCGEAYYNRGFANLTADNFQAAAEDFS